MRAVFSGIACLSRAKSRGDAHRAILVLSLFALIGCTPITEWRPEKTEVRSRDEIPITLVKRGLPFIAIPNPDGSKPDPRNATYAMIDTGAAVSAASAQFVESRKLEKRPEPTLELRDTHYNKLTSHYVVRVPQLDMAGARFTNFDAVVDRSGVLGGPLDVVLGRPVFVDVVMTIDYPRRTLSFSDEPLPEPNGKDVLPLDRDNNGNLLVPITIDGTSCSAILDTGAVGAGMPVTKDVSLRLHWTGPFVEHGQTRSWFSSETTRLGRIRGDLKIGQYTIRQPMVSVTDASTANYLGSNVLRHFIVTIDQHNERVRLTLPDPRAANLTIETPPLRSIGFSASPEGLITIQPPSEATKAGLRDGDRLVSIEGVPIARVTDAVIDQIERRGDPITLRVVRGDKPLVLRVPVTTIMP